MHAMLGVSSLFITMVSYGQTPIFDVYPLAGSGPALSLGSGEHANLAYVVTNLSKRAHAISYQNKSGFSQTTTSSVNGMPNCASSTVLQPKTSCLLSILVVANEIKQAESMYSGPVVCADGGQFLCVQPSLSNALRIRITDEGATQLLSSVSSLALSVNDRTLNTALTGHARSVTISNSTSTAFTNVIYSFEPALPTDASVAFAPSTSACETLNPGDSCTITITPGATSASSFLIVQSASTAAVTWIPVHILTYGSVYQGGYLFSMDDTTASTGSVGGKVLSLSDQALTWPLGIVWSANGNAFPKDYATCVATCDNVVYPFSGGTPPTSNTDGSSNNALIVDFYNNYYNSQGSTGEPAGSCNNSFPPTCPPPDYPNPTLIDEPVPTSTYAAGLCTETIASYSDWYLPAICEMGYNILGGPNNSGCGYQHTPLMQNIQSNLLNHQIITLNGLYWSSTQCSDSSICSITLDAWYQFFDSASGSFVNQNFDNKKDPSGVRCVRALTQP
jgi:hypothetical protein